MWAYVIFTFLYKFCNFFKSTNFFCNNNSEIISTYYDVCYNTELILMENLD